MSFDKWREFLNENPKRSSPAGIRRSMGALLDSGEHTGGSPYDKKDDESPRLKGKRTRNQVSAPPGAEGGGSIGAPGGALEEEVEEETFLMQSELQPEIWREEQMWPEVRERLLEIVNDFLEGLDVDVPLEDVRLTGSLANYNWSKFSDIDLHILLEFGHINEDQKLVKKFFDAVRSRWNKLHDIRVKGHEVEIYVQDQHEPHTSTGVYSLMEDNWLVKPTKIKPQLDKASAEKKMRFLAKEIDKLAALYHNKQYESALEMGDRIKDKIKRMRQTGLERAGIYAPENLAFKMLRRSGDIERLFDMYTRAYDQVYSLDQ